MYYLRSNIVAPLRDKGLLIASSEKGYKLLVPQDDLEEYVNFSSLKIIPMLNRLERCREQILLAVKKELDIMDYTKYEQLKKYFDGENASLRGGIQSRNYLSHYKLVSSFNRAGVFNIQIRQLFSILYYFSVTNDVYTERDLKGVWNVLKSFSN
ncbi:hypothetical protein [Virgibacillus ndiopensis]|uniref:hypothetical protein n=1 Tax=Virgibacillus ndiopensis TaxID=2004408 RepID=UPI001145E68E|nr:hypothetical protein [Virgibacillus ndiopensis]